MLLESEQLWDSVRRRLAEEWGGAWDDEAQRRMMGMNTGEWTTFMADHLGLDATPAAIEEAVVERLSALYRRSPPVLPGAVAAVRRLARRWPLAVASSSPRRLIATALDAAGLSRCFREIVSSEEVERGKPAPDVFVEAAGRLGRAPGDCVAIEDSTSGLRAAVASGARVVAIPNREYPPAGDAVASAHLRLPSIAWLWPRAVERAWSG